jgi:tricorn protease
MRIIISHNLLNTSAMKLRLIFIASLLIVTGLLLPGQEEAGLLRFPSICGDQIVFSHAGDLYTVSAKGGMARKLTTNIGYEVFPHFSPDGRFIAFTGQYDGNTEVYLIPSQGGTPKRLTYTATLTRDDVADRMGPNNIVMEWTPDGKNIIYRSRRKTFNDFTGQLFMVPVEGGLSKEIELTNSGFCSFSPDGKKLAFNWVFREFRTWKYYVGGMADNIRIYDMASGNIEQITNNINQNIFPMWVGDEIFFLSDRDRTMNMFAYNTLSKKTEKVTSFDNYDIKFPTRSKDVIVFENGGFIYKYDTKSRKQEKVSIAIADDEGASLSVMKDASQRITSVSPSVDGERIVISARGEIFNIPVREGVTRNLTNTSGVHERNAKWSPDGRFIAWISDASGEFEIWMQKFDASEPPSQVTKDQKTYLFNISWSPDSKKIIYNTRKNDLRYVDIQSGKIIIVDRSPRGPYYQANWSPDSKWIAFVRPEQTFPIIRLYNVESAAVTDLTDSWYSSGEPVFSSDGKYLFFVSERDFNPSFSNTEFNNAYFDMSRIYLITLAKDVPSPFAAKDDQVKVVEAIAGVPSATDDKKKLSESPKTENGPKSVKIDLGGIRDRIISLPVQPANYRNLVSVGDKIFYNMNSQKGGASGTKYYDLKDKKEVDVGQGLSLTLVPDGKKMLVSQAGKYSIIPVPSGKAEIKENINTGNMKVLTDLSQEWKNIFNEEWRQMRDFFYDPNLHGADWQKIHDKYAIMLPWVNHRNDLSYLIGEMVAELSVGHAYVNNGDRPLPERISTGLLGAGLSRDQSGYVKIDRILEGANWNEDLISPLEEIGINVREGDFIIAVNGTAVNKVNDIYELLVGQAGKLVELTVNSRPEAAGSRKVIVKPVASESALYYYNWVQKNTRKVSEATNGRVGYIHIPDMGIAGLNQFVEHYYPQLQKEALIIDDRGNGGGNVSPQIIERLMRTITFATMFTGYKTGDVNPVGTHLGPKVALCDKYSASDGDLLSYRFKYNKIGPLIGTRTWGGVVGFSGSVPVIDGGSIITPSYAPFAADGSGFIIEGHGVDPDIVIENDPHKEYLGQDDQLNKAIEVALELLKTDGKKIPPIPPFPDKSGKK